MIIKPIKTGVRILSSPKDELAICLQDQRLMRSDELIKTRGTRNSYVQRLAKKSFHSVLNL